MQFIDLKKQQNIIREKLNQRIADVLGHGRYIMGPEVFELEKNLSEFVNVKHCISCSSGTDALLMALMAWDIGPGDAVFTSPFTFIATAEVIQLLGAKPVFVDIDEKTFEPFLYMDSEPDLIIRTGGDHRTSNFLAWQGIYSEWFFLEKMWPEFEKEDFVKVIDDFQNRQRRFGK